jgi:phosphomethylpyrimidine synthase
MKDIKITVGKNSQTLPMHGAVNPSTENQGTSPGSFALQPKLGGATTFSSPDTPGMPAASTKTAHDFNPSPNANPVTQLEHARLGTVTPEMVRVAQREPHLTAEQIRDEVAAGRMIIPANIVHLALGLDPIYSMIIDKKIEDLSYTMIMDELENQAKQGVDYFTIHAGVLHEHIPFIKDRLIGIVSRGGSLLAKWMIHHNKQNPMYECFDDICDLMRQYDVSFSLGDGLRPGGLADATDEAQIRELEVLGELTERAWAKGVQVMVEGPGHVSFDQIEYNMKLQRTLCHGAPFYVLGPLVTDIFPGYDHITSCIGATAAAYHGASMLCYVTPKEHLGLPKKDDVKQGCVAYKISAHSADIALGIPGSRDNDDELTKARAALNWQKHFDLSFDPDFARAMHDEDMDVDTDFCAMCGHDWCSVRISKEIQEFASGKDENYAWDKPKVSAALTIEQKEILEQRGVLTPEEVHKLASKVKGKMTSDTESEVKPSCHSDVAESSQAMALQEDQ